MNMAAPPSLYLGASRSLDGQEARALRLPAHHLTTHAVVVGMTGSGKTGLLTVMVEEALRQSVPVLMIDVKGDLPNLLLAFPNFAPERVEPWVEPAPGDARTAAEIARELSQQREHGLQSWNIGEKELHAFNAGVDVQVITPGSSAGTPLHVLSRSPTGTPIPTLPEPPFPRRCRSSCGCSAATQIPPRAATTS
jgi:hypothetical protein